MKRLFLFLFLIGSIGMNAQETGTIEGTVLDNSGASVPGANIEIKSLSKGVVSDFDGRFTITEIAVGEYQLTISYIGYQTVTQSVSVTAGATTDISVTIVESESLLNEIIITANKKAEKLTEVPATISVITRQDIEEFAGFNPGELAARQKGVDFVRTGVLGTGINIRGFNSAFNPKNLQVTDDRLSTLIATGLPLGTFSTVTKDDIDHVEILLGPNGMLYGPNAHNGLINTVTKNPRTSQGTTVAVSGGNQNVLSLRARHAQVINNKFAYKVHAERSQGREFKYVDSVYVGTNAYPELGLDRDFNTTKYGASLFYRPTTNSEIIGYYGHSNNNNVAVTNAGRNQIKDWSIDVAQLKYVSDHIFVNTYYTWSNTEDTYALNQRTQNYVSFIENGFPVAEALERSFTEQWNPDLGIALPRGAVFEDASRRFNAEGQYNNNWGQFFATAGAQYQLDMANSNGTYLLDQDGSIDIGQTGVYAQFEYKFEDLGLNILAGGRVDNHELYGTNFLPKAAITKLIEGGSFRLTYGKGIAVPSILNLKGNLFGGLVLGNGEGFTLTDGTQIQALEVETINSYEVGYKGQIGKQLFLDVNAYYNQSEDFISPLVNVADAANGNNVTHVGDTPIGQILPGVNESAFLLTYLNFGKVDTYGFDVGVNYYFTDQWRATLNYSYFGRNLDKDDPNNDGNLDGVVLESELPINTPENKVTAGLHYKNSKFYGSVYGRWIQDYDFFSGINIAAETQDLDGDGVNDIIENAQNGRTWNYGPLGGFTVDLNLGYNFTENFSVGANVTNVFNADVREFVASPIIGTLLSVEAKYTMHLFDN